MKGLNTNSSKRMENPISESHLSVGTSQKFGAHSQLEIDGTPIIAKLINKKKKRKKR